MASRKRRHTKATFSDLVHPNFEELSREYPDFGKAWQIVRQHQKEHGGSLATNVTQEFSIATTRALLHTYFSLRLPQVPTLCPPVPNRYYFVRWITQEVLPMTRRPAYFEPTEGSQPHPRTQFGIDLGTGATCIYPLLFCASTVEIEEDDARGEWKWLASEIDPNSTEMAIQNVQANRRTSKIQVVQVLPTSTQTASKTSGQNAVMDVDGSYPNDNSSTAASGPILRLLEALPIDSRPTGQVDIIMTNPPFHEPTSSHTTQPVRSGDHRARTCLTESEASYPGGEVQFLVDIIVDSLQLMPHPSHQSQPAGENTLHQLTLTSLWYSSMFGKKTSWVQVSRILTYMLGPARVQSTEFGPGNLMRWFLAWTFGRPNSRSPLGAYGLSKSSTNPPKQGVILAFDLTLEDQGEIDQGVIPAVLERIVVFFTTFPGFALATQVAPQGNFVTVREERPHVVDWDDNLLPSAILEVLRRRQISFMDLLPHDGHFVVDISVSACSTTSVSVQLKAFAHSQYGRIVIEKIATRAQSDICRTSRRWRRLLQRQQAERTENHQPTSMEES